VSKLESAEEFAEELACSVWDGMRADIDLSPLQQYERLARLIEADRNAVRLELLDELEAEADRNGAQCGEDNYSESIARLRAKYGKDPR